MSFKNIFIFLFGAFFSFLLAYFYINFNKEESQVINKDYYILNNQIDKLNKMIVLEQNFSSFQTHKSSAFRLGNIDVFPKEMVLYSTAKAQVSYDLKKMKIEVDSIQKKLIIKELPSPEVKIFPEVKIHFMDDYAVNRFSKTDLNNILESAKRNMRKNINQEKLKFDAKKQLLSNLDEIFVLARFLDYKIEDETQQLNEIL